VFRTERGGAPGFIWVAQKWKKVGFPEGMPVCVEVSVVLLTAG
jgi:hypothetical protein